MTLSKFTICAIVHLHTVGLNGFVTLLGEKGFPPPKGLAVKSGLNGFALGQPRSSAWTGRRKDSKGKRKKSTRMARLRLAEQPALSVLPAWERRKRTGGE